MPSNCTNSFTELLTNAMHATPIGGSIHVRGEAVRLNADGTVPLPEGDYVRLSVRDEGLGIPDQHLTRIFEPFFSTKGECARPGPGHLLPHRTQPRRVHDG